MWKKLVIVVFVLLACNTGFADKHVDIDRHVLNTQDWKSDPSILYAGPRRVYKPREEVITKVVRVDEDPTPSVTVKASVQGEEGSAISVPCTENNNTITCDWN